MLSPVKWNGLKSAAGTGSAVLACLQVGLLCVSQASAGAQPAAAPAERDSGTNMPVSQEERAPETPLQAGKPVGREIKGGETHTYSVRLRAGEYLEIVVEQQGIDLGVTLVAPDGEPVGTIDSPNGKNGPEVVCAIAAVGGTYSVAVRPLGKTAAPGRYEVRLSEPRPPAERDRNRAGAWLARSEAERLRRQKTPESRRMAVEKYSEALALFRALGDRYWEAHTLSRLGVLCWGLGEHQKALEHFSAALPLMREIGDAKREASTLNQLGVIYSALGEPQKALQHYSAALSLWQKLGERSSEVKALTNIGLVYWYLGEQQKALDYYSRALPLAESLGERAAQAYALNSIGLVYWSLGEPQKALEYYNSALPLVRAERDTGGEAQTLNQIGSAYRDLGEYKLSLDSYTQALRLLQASGDISGQGQLLSNIGSIYSSLGEYQTALDYYSRALPLRHAAGNRSGEALTVLGAGRVYASVKQYEKALDYCERALSLMRATGNRSGEATALYSIAAAERDRGNFSRALTQIEAALAIIEDVRAKVASSQLRTSYLASKHEYYELYIDLLMRLHKQHPEAGYDGRALHASERARARSLLEILAQAGADIRAGADPKLVERERALQQRIDAVEIKRMRLLGGNPTEAQKAELEKERESLLDQYQELQAQLRIASPRYAALTQPQPLTLPEIQQQVLDAGTLLLEYSLGDERSYLWAVTKTGITSYSLPPRADIEKAATAFRDVLKLGERASAASLTAAGKALSDKILAPALQQLGGKRLLVVSDGILEYIPFAALPAPGKDSGYIPIIQEREIVNLPSASALAIIRRDTSKRKPAPKTLAVIADPVFGTDDERVRGMVALGSVPVGAQQLQRAAADAGIQWNRLPFTRNEAQQILSLVPETQRQQAFDFAASRAAATSSELSPYRIVHFATHGLANSERPELSGIVLSLLDEKGSWQNGYLRLNDIFNLNLTAAELIVLSACDTGLGKEIKGEGLVGLTRGFMYAGAPRVVVSLWKVDDRATAELMVRFYQKMLKEGKPAAAALREAQLQMWEETQWKLPYYWAAFVLQGEWR